MIIIILQWEHVLKSYFHYLRNEIEIINIKTFDDVFCYKDASSVADAYKWLNENPSPPL